jgi:mono/diheme cytochrome c family protein
VSRARKSFLACTTVMAALAAAGSSGWSQDADTGRAEFLANCAGCHGADAKGSGSRSANLKIKPADLTALARRNKGVFAPDTIYQMIDGREGRPSHRSTDMPIWGCRQADAPTEPAVSASEKRYGARLTARKKQRESDLESLLDLPCDSEAAIRRRIMSIVDYLGQIQEK